MNCKPFTYDEYRYILKRLETQGYRFVDYHEALEDVHNPNTQHFAVIRHDLDVSLENAIKIAKIDNELNIQSTFFILVNTNFYHVFWNQDTLLIKGLQSLDREIGLHFAFQEKPEAWVLNHERIGFEGYYQTKIDFFTIHCPHKLNEEFSALLYGLQNVSEIQNVKYFGDGWGQWRHGHPLESDEFKQGKPLHLNFHPIWWNEEPKSPLICLNEFIKRKNKELKWNIAQNLMGF